MDKLCDSCKKEQFTCRANYKDVKFDKNDDVIECKYYEIINK